MAVGGLGPNCILYQGEGHALDKEILVLGHNAAEALRGKDDVLDEAQLTMDTLKASIADYGDFFACHGSLLKRRYQQHLEGFVGRGGVSSRHCHKEMGEEGPNIHHWWDQDK